MKKSKFIIAIMILSLLLIATLNPVNAESNKYVEPQHIASEMSKKGVDTKGISFIAHDLYFDGSYLMLSVTMRPNDEKFTAVEDTIGDHNSFTYDGKESAENLLGVYCDISVTDLDGNEIGSPINGGGEYNGNAYMRTFVVNFEPDKSYEEVVCNIYYGIMEKPGKLTEEEMSVFHLIAAVQNKAEKYEVPLDSLAEELSYINRIFVAQSEKITSAFVYYTGSKSLPIPLSFADDEMVIDYPDSSVPNYLFHAYSNGDMQAIKIKDAKTNNIYSIDIKSGKCTLEK